MTPTLRRARLAAWLERRGDPLETWDVWERSGLYASLPYPEEFGDAAPGVNHALTDLLVLLAAGTVRIWKPARHCPPLRWVHATSGERLVTPVGYAGRVAA